MIKRHELSGGLAILYMEGTPFLQVGEFNLEGEIYDWLKGEGLIKEPENRSYLVTGLTISVKVEVTDGA